MAKNGKSGNRHIVVFDMGKTNKKLVVFDGSLRPVHSVYQVFEEVQRDGVSYETVEETSLWLLDNLKEIAARFEPSAEAPFVTRMFVQARASGATRTRDVARARRAAGFLMRGSAP